ncbi:MAG TPA: hypothetical protein VMD30_09415, partial [Tepidisphaeraceae bacterium]|nr:hypothetical protein [Tepidisphaeraceae bacterium]
MFDRRLKILLMFLCLVTLTLMLRAAQVQLAERQKWADAAADLLRIPDFVETTRGSILDRLGRVIAVDQPCIDACVDYRAIALSEPAAADDPVVLQWLDDQAAASLTRRLGDDFLKQSKARRKQMIADEVVQVRKRIANMWKVLAAVSGQSLDQIDQVRHSIYQRVELRKRYVWLENFERAMAQWKGTSHPTHWYDRWM